DANRVIARVYEDLTDASLRPANILAGWITIMANFYRNIEERYPSGCSYYEALWRTLMVDRVTCRLDSPSPEGFVEAITYMSGSPLSREFWGTFGDCVAPRTFYITRRGYIGLAPDNVRVGDTLAIFLGG